MVRPAGFEPATLGLEGPMSDRLFQDGYIRALLSISDGQDSGLNPKIRAISDANPITDLRNPVSGPGDWSDVRM